MYIKKIIDGGICCCDLNSYFEGVEVPLARAVESATGQSSYPNFATSFDNNRDTNA